ncbi:sensory neuron membrane protein 1-like [Contarinia nasturtii]|uniref:sensory neuron membrane protein 1-like n=1 Tax=Contarinia nasturtii TaxID=265458 RepID=UPI0012D3C142|nr:sensory neuron membrane protein 1-like [Contarinia nasturtii]
MSQPFRFKRRSYGRLAIIFGGLFVISFATCYFIFDLIVDFIVKNNLNLKKGGIERGIYEALPFPLTYQVYIFHILNKDEVKNGAKPHFKEMGPYSFDEIDWKNNISDDEEEDTMSFNLNKEWLFRPDLSNGLTGEEIITTLHPVIVAIGLTAHFEMRQYLHVASTAIDEIFHEPKDVFWTGRAMDLISDGIEIDCSTTNPLAKIACRMIRKSGIQMIQRVDTQRMKFSFLGGFNRTVNGYWTMNRGIKNIYDAGNVVAVDGQRELTVWGKEGKCNQITGGDTLVFVPYQTIEKPMLMFVRQLCFTLQMKFVRKAIYRGIDLHVFAQEFNITATNEFSCFCRKPDRCPIQGTMDMYQCLKVPVIISQPHFYHADPSLLANIVDGLKPDQKKHEFAITLEMKTGVALKVAARVQINFPLEPVAEIEIMKNLPNMTFPWVWAEKNMFQIPDSLVNLMKYTLTVGNIFRTTLAYLTWTIFFFGTIFCTTIFILTQYTEYDILEDERVFLRTSGIVKIEQVSAINQNVVKEGNDLIKNEKRSRK